MDTLILILYAWHIKKKKKGWRKIYILLGLKRGPFLIKIEMTVTQLAAVVFLYCLQRNSARQQIVHPSPSPNWLKTHTLIPSRYCTRWSGTTCSSLSCCYRLSHLKKSSSLQKPISLLSTTWYSSLLFMRTFWLKALHPFLLHSLHYPPLRPPRL